MHAEGFFAALGADIRTGGNRAFYAPGYDFVQMPDFATFKSAAAFYGTLAHEICHWTKHERRLDRDFQPKKWGDESYAMEE